MGIICLSPFFFLFAPNGPGADFAHESRVYPEAGGVSDSDWIDGLGFATNLNPQAQSLPGLGKQRTNRNLMKELRC